MVFMLKHPQVWNQWLTLTQSRKSEDQDHPSMEALCQCVCQLSLSQYVCPGVVLLCMECVCTGDITRQSAASRPLSHGVKPGAHALRGPHQPAHSKALAGKAWARLQGRNYCPVCRTSLIATRFWVVVICPIIKCLTVLEISFILFDLCLFITIFNFVLNYVPTGLPTSKISFPYFVEKISVFWVTFPYPLICSSPDSKLNFLFTLVGSIHSQWKL